MADGTRFNPSIFDKLTSDLGGARRAEEDGERPRDGAASAGPFRFYTVPRIDRFGAPAVRSVLLRDLGWLFGTVNLGSRVDLSDFPQVQSSVLNFGVSDLAGHTGSRRLTERRAKELRSAVRAYEPRLAVERLDVEVAETPERDNAVTFTVRSDVVSTLQPLPVAFKTDVELDSGAAMVRD